MNVYCNLLNIGSIYLEYAIGGLGDDITGRMIVNTVTGEYEIIKPPENSRVYDRHVESLVRRIICETSKGIFREKIAREIG